jgi:hypothetical protein
MLRKCQERVHPELILQDELIKQFFDQEIMTYLTVLLDKIK